MTIDRSQIGVVILAGGLGTRVQRLLPGRPKPMALVAGRPFLEWIIRYLARQGLRRVVISAGYLAEVIENHFLLHPVPHVSAVCIKEATPLGTAGAFLHAARLSGEAPFVWLVLNGDTLAFVNLPALITTLEETAISAVIAGRWMPETSRYGTLAVGPGEILVKFEEKKPGAGVVNTGIYLFRRALLSSFPDRLPLSFEQDVFPVLTASGVGVKVYLTNAPWLDIGTPESLARAGSFVQQHLSQFTQD